MSVDLRVDWCDHKAAEFACKHWHYSKSMPAGKLVKIGAWENCEFIGCVLFSWGANLNIGSPYRLNQVEVCELVRVALSEHLSPVSQIVSSCIKMLARQSPGVRLIISYADPEQLHIGTIYQAMNWVYEGITGKDKRIQIGGKWVHRRTVHELYGHSGTANVKTKTVYKHKYLYPLDRAMRKQVAPLSRPYPKREPCVQSVEGDTAGDQLAGEGSIPSDRSHTGQQPVLLES